MGEPVIAPLGEASASVLSLHCGGDGKGCGQCCSKRAEWPGMEDER